MLTGTVAKLRGTDKVKRAVYQWIEKNRPRQGEKFYSQNELAKLLKVDPLTAHKAMTELTKEGIFYRVKGKGTFVKKQHGQVESIKFLLPGPGCLTLDNPDAKVVQCYLAGILHEAHKANIRVETVICTADHKYTSLQSEQFSSFNKHANVFVLSQWWHPVFAALAQSGCNVVYENSQRMRTEFTDIFSNWYLLTNDVVKETSNVVGYFAQMGRRKILGFNIQDSQFDHPDPRTTGYRQGLELNNIEFDEQLMPTISYDDYKNYDKMIELIIETYEKTPFDAIVVPSFRFSAPFQTAIINRLGLKCPDDVAMVALEDSEMNLDLPVPVSAIGVDHYKLGVKAVQAFQRAPFTAGEKVMSSQLIERASSRKGAGAAHSLDFSNDVTNELEASFFN